ncbi:pyrroline-5-carboxylate reductase [Actinotignum schaalii]|uniref:pyrroline-5-carboxylate reductase n=1 Tax=Actinotignum schaalii TaxID=59505 RepID=UPI0003F79CAC|nr:pyrroline-5-carboxylate reductase [Actinotignum schaalii]WQN45669.1 pyrroline-5-carboxylate reductase [Actinotignum schaalii]
MIGFIGTGHMGGALARGVLAAGADPASVVVSAKDAQAARDFAEETGARPATSNTELVTAVGDGIVVVAVKPYAVADVLEEINDVARESGTVIVSIAAGLELATLARHLAPGQPLVRAMPNVAASVRASMTALCFSGSVTPAQQDAVREVFAAVGAHITLEEKHFSVFSALAGCSPAFTFTYIDALKRAAVADGLPAAQAVRIAAQAVEGAARLVLASELSPADLADTVQSPGGTTVAGVVELERAGFGAAVVRGVQASIDKDRNLS